jgi:hypothetical protein
MKEQITREIQIIKQDLKHSIWEENKGMPTKLLQTHFKKANVSNFSEDHHHPKGRRETGQPPRRWKDQFA